MEIDNSKKKLVIGSIVLVVLILLYVRYKKKGYLLWAKKQVPKNDEEKSYFTKYDKGDDDFRGNGIYVFKIDWKNKTFHYMIVADNESIQGKFEWNPVNEHRKGNSGGTAKMSTGWVFNYGKRTKNGVEYASLTLANPAKKTSFNKIVDFTNKIVG